MQTNQSRVKGYLFIFITAFGLVVIDQLTKFWIRTHLAIGQSWPETGFFRFTYAQNTGAAFSIFYGKVEILTVVSIIGFIFLLAFIFIIHRHFLFLNTFVNKLSLGILLAGTAGNLIDRLILRHVTDFIDVGPWPVFNVADMSIVLGVVLFALSLLFTNYEFNLEHHQ
jgi:signal peptidase II